MSLLDRKPVSMGVGSGSVRVRRRVRARIAGGELAGVGVCSTGYLALWVVGWVLGHQR